MFTFPISHRKADRRPQTRPPVEDLEGRLLLSGIQGRHIGTSAMIVGNHIGTSAMIVGNHIGTSVVSDVVVMRKH